MRTPFKILVPLVLFAAMAAAIPLAFRKGGGDGGSSLPPERPEYQSSSLRTDKPATENLQIHLKHERTGRVETGSEGVPYKVGQAFTRREGTGQPANRQAGKPVPQSGGSAAAGHAQNIKRSRNTHPYNTASRGDAAIYSRIRRITAKRRHGSEKQPTENETTGQAIEIKKNQQDGVTPLIITNVIDTVALRTGEKALFSAKDVSGNSGAIAEYSWDFDASDGWSVEASGIEATHAYFEPGLYTVTLRAEGNGGEIHEGTIQIPVAGEITLPPPNAAGYFTCITLLDDDRVLAFDGFAVHRQKEKGLSDFEEIAHIPDGEAADPAFIKVAPDNDTVYLGAGAGGKKVAQSNGRIWRFKLSDCAEEEIIAEKVAVFPYHFDMQFGPDGKIYMSYSPGFSGVAGGMAKSKVSVIDPATWESTLLVETPGPSCGICFDSMHSLYVGRTSWVFPAPPGTGSVRRYGSGDVDRALAVGAVLGEADGRMAAGELASTQFSIAVDNSGRLYSSGRCDGEAPVCIDTSSWSGNTGDAFPRLVGRNGSGSSYYSQMTFRKKSNTLGVVFTTDWAAYRALIIKLPESAETPSP